MNTHNIISQAKEEIKKGDFFDILKAKNLLMENGFINRKDPEIQQAFYQLFPPSKELQHELDTSLKQLLEKDPAARLKAAVYLERIPRKSMNGIIEMWLKDPRTIEILCKALDDDDPAVQENIIMCLGNIADRYKYTDLDIYSKIVSKYSGAPDQIKVRIAQSVCAFPTDEKWEIILRSFDIKPTAGTRAILGRCIFGYGDQMPAATKEKFLVVLFDALYKEKKTDTRYSLIRALELIGDEDTIAELKKAKIALKAAGLKNDFDVAIQAIEKRVSNKG